MLTLVFMQANFYHVQTVLEECTDSSGLALAWHVSNTNSVLLICEYISCLDYKCSKMCVSLKNYPISLYLLLY